MQCSSVLPHDDDSFAGETLDKLFALGHLDGFIRFYSHDFIIVDDAADEDFCVRNAEGFSCRKAMERQRNP